MKIKRKIKRKEIFYFSLVMLVLSFFYQIGYMGPFEFKMKTDGRVKTSIPFAAVSYFALSRTLFSDATVLYDEKKLSKDEVFNFPRGEVSYLGAGLEMVISHPFYELKREGYNLNKNWSGLITCCWTVQLPDYEVRSYEALAEEDYLPRIKAAYAAGDEEGAVKIQYELSKRIFSGIRHWAFLLRDKKVDVELFRTEIIQYYTHQFPENYIFDNDTKEHLIKFVSKNIDRGLVK